MAAAKNLLEYQLNHGQQKMKQQWLANRKQEKCIQPTIPLAKCQRSAKIILTKGVYLKPRKGGHQSNGGRTEENTVREDADLGEKEEDAEDKVEREGDDDSDDNNDREWLPNSAKSVTVRHHGHGVKRVSPTLAKARCQRTNDTVSSPAGRKRKHASDNLAPNSCEGSVHSSAITQAVKKNWSPYKGAHVDVKSRPSTGHVHPLSPHRAQFPQAWELSKREARNPKQSSPPQLTGGYAYRPPVVIAGIRTGLGTTAAPKRRAPVTAGQDFHCHIGQMNIEKENKEEKEESYEQVTESHLDTSSSEEEDDTTTDSESEDDGTINPAVNSKDWVEPVENDDEEESESSDDEWLPKPKNEHLSPCCAWPKRRSAKGKKEQTQAKKESAPRPRQTARKTLTVRCKRLKKAPGGAALLEAGVRAANGTGKAPTKPRRASSVKGFPERKPFSDVQCDVCGAVVHNNSLGRHMAIHEDLRQFVCEICGEGFNSRPTLNAHMFTHTRTSKYRCTLCGESFRSRQSLRRHSQRHRRFHEVYECAYCELPLPTPESCREHYEAAHGSGSKCKVWCVLCKAVIATHDEFAQHFRLKHSNEIANQNIEDYIILQCTVCKRPLCSLRSFAFHQSLPKHPSKVTKAEFLTKLKPHSTMRRSRKHRGRRFTCETCNDCFFFNTSLVRHCSHVHGLKKTDRFLCRLCCKLFTSRKRLKQHICRERCAALDRRVKAEKTVVDRVQSETVSRRKGSSRVHDEVEDKGETCRSNANEKGDSAVAEDSLQNEQSKELDSSLFAANHLEKENSTIETAKEGSLRPKEAGSYCQANNLGNPGNISLPFQQADARDGHCHQQAGALLSSSSQQDEQTGVNDGRQRADDSSAMCVRKERLAQMCKVWVKLSTSSDQQQEHITEVSPVVIMGQNEIRPGEAVPDLPSKTSEASHGDSGDSRHHPGSCPQQEPAKEALPVSAVSQGENVRHGEVVQPFPGNTGEAGQIYAVDAARYQQHQQLHLLQHWQQHAWQQQWLQQRYQWEQFHLLHQYQHQQQMMTTLCAVQPPLTGASANSN